MLLAHGMHDFNPRDDTTRSPKGFAAQHQTCNASARSVVFFDNVIEILRAAYDDGRLVSPIIVRARGSTVLGSNSENPA